VHSQQLEDCRPGLLYSPMPVVHFTTLVTAQTPLEARSNTGPLFHGQLSASPSTRRKSAIELNVTEMGLSKSLPAVAASPLRSPASAIQELGRRGSFTQGDLQARRLSSSPTGPLARRTSSGGISPQRRISAANDYGKKMQSLLHQDEAPNQYECPLYRTSKHEGTLLSSGQSKNHICTIYLPTAADPSRWILAGVSLVCEPDE